jgi:inosose dehydratase
MPSRRQFLQTSSLATIGFTLTAPSLNFSNSGPHIACQQYPWSTFFRRQGKDWSAELGHSFQQVAKAGLEGFEPSFNSFAEVKPVGKQLKKQKLRATSLYVNSTLHEEEQIEASLKKVLEIAAAAKTLGIKIIVTNPTPIRWGGDEDKTDQQLKRQARALDALGGKLRSMGLTLAYHNHDAEMRQGAREFHHMMMGTAPANVHLCLDAHWIFRGAGDSQIAVFDIFQLYADRVVELHLRQSQQGIWTEVFGPGDLDYERLAEALLRKDQKPHLVLEQAVEKKSPQTLQAVEAHRRSLAYARELFADFVDE